VVVQTGTAARRELVVPVRADGTLEPLPGGEVRAPEAGVVGSLLAREGDRVARGTPLLRIDTPDLSQRVLSSRSDSAQLAGELQKSESEAAAARAESAHLRSAAEASARLLAVGAITRQQETADRVAYEQSEIRRRQAEAQVVEIAKRKQLVDAGVRDLQRRERQLTLLAPADGVVYNLPRAASESLSPGQLVATIAETGRLRVRARVDAPDLPRVRAGQRMVVTFDGLPNQKWNGSVVRVPPGLREAGGREVGEIVGELEGDARSLPVNAPVNVEIVVGERSSALIIPRGALSREGDQRIVYKLVGGKARRTPVVVGLIGPREVEVSSGLAAGDRVILSPSVPLRDGQAVRVSP